MITVKVSHTLFFLKFSLKMYLVLSENELTKLVCLTISDASYIFSLFMQNIISANPKIKDCRF